jgi:drug/metabolite transporter (DMT)-like permease
MTSTDSTGRSYLPDIALFLSTAVWGFSFTVLKLVLGLQVSEVLFVFLRFLVASLLLYPLCRRRLRSLGDDGVKAGILLGVLIFAGFITQSIGITYTTASKSAFVTGLSTGFVPIFLLLHRGKMPEPPIILALVFAIAGMYMLTGPAGGGFNLGDLLTLACAIVFGAQIYVMGIATRKFDTLALTWVELSATTFIAALFLPMQNIRFEFSLEPVGAVLFMGVIATALALSIQTWAQKKVSAVRAGLIYAAEPVFAYIFASALLGERFNLVQKAGGAVIIVAILAGELLPTLLRTKRNAVAG